MIHSKSGAGQHRRSPGRCLDGWTTLSTPAKGRAEPFSRLSSSAKADDPVRRAFSIHRDAGDYWMPAFAGMTRRTKAEAIPAFQSIHPEKIALADFHAV